MSDWWSTPDGHRWTSHVRHQVLPKLSASTFVMTIDPSGEVDIKIAVELGLAILLGKPIIAVTTPGRVPNRGLTRVADVMIEADYSHPERVAEQLRDAMRRLGLDDG